MDSEELFDWILTIAMIEVFVGCNIVIVILVLGLLGVSIV